MWLRKDKGGTSIGPYRWPGDGSVTEVPDHLAADLLAIPDGGYSKAAAPEPKAEPKAAPKPPAEPAAKD